jgi:hypothetical protein
VFRALAPPLLGLGQTLHVRLSSPPTVVFSLLFACVLEKGLMVEIAAFIGTIN